MNYKKLLLALFIALCVLGPKQANSQNSAASRQFRKGEVIVEIKPGASIDTINARIGTRTAQQIYGTNLYRLVTPKLKKEKKFLKKLEKDNDVLSATLNPTVTSTLFGRSTFSFPDGFAKPGRTALDFRSQQPLFDLIRLNEAQLRSKGRGVIVAIIDTGVDLSHPLLSHHVWIDDRTNADIIDGIDNDEDGLLNDFRGWDFLQNDNNPMDEPGDPQTTVAGHGTFIAGLIAYIAPEARILPVRAFPPDGVADVFTVASAIKYAADHGAHVINLSLGSPEAHPLLADAINYAKERGAVLIAATGNDNSSIPQYPSSADDVLAVSAIDITSHKAAFSNFGAHVDVTAPGVGIISAFPGSESEEYAQWSGTSFAAPFAVGQAALLLSLDPANTNILQIIKSSAVNIDQNNQGFAGMMGTGRIDLAASLACMNLDCAEVARDVKAEIALARGTGVTAGRGRAEIEVSGPKQEFEIEAVGLSPRSSYRLFVNGVDISGATASASLGYLKLKFSTQPTTTFVSNRDENKVSNTKQHKFAEVAPKRRRPKTETRPLDGSINPVTKIKHIELREDLTGHIVLKGDFSSAAPTLSDQKVEKEARLYALTPANYLGGKSKVKLEAGRETLKIEAEGLTPNSNYKIIVDGIDLSTNPALTSDRYLKVEFTSDGSSGYTLPQSLRPAINIRHVEVRDAAGTLILQGDFQPGGSVGDDSGSQTPGEISINRDFTRTGSDADAEGDLKIYVRGLREDLELKAKNLAASSFYTVYINDSLFYTFRTDNKGEFEREWSTAPESGQLMLPDSVRPLTGIHTIEIRTISGVTVMVVHL